jgi:branched-chain amino acid aminotransferase
MIFRVSIDGRIQPPGRGSVPVTDRGFLYGDSVYEVIRTYRGRLFALREHLDRLERSAERLQLGLPPRARIERAVRRTVEAGGFDETYCRIIVTRGGGPISLDPTRAIGPRTVVIVKPFEPLPPRAYRRGVTLAIPGISRHGAAGLDPSVKSGNYLNSVLAFGAARRAGFDDAILVDRAGRVTECTSANLFAWRGGVLCTPPLAAGLLEGVTRGILLRIAPADGFTVRECRLRPEDLFAADEVMMSSTLREVVPVVRVEDAVIGAGRPGPVARRLRTSLRAYARQRVSEE